MNLLNIVKHLLYLTQTEYGSEKSSTTTDEISTAERLFEVLKSINVSYFTELYTHDTLDFEDEYDELTDEEQSNDDINDYNENEHSGINDHFTLEEIEKIVEWVDQHPNAGLATISHRFKKIKYMYYITRFRQYIKNNGTRLEKLNKVKELMFNQFYLKRTIEKEAIHDDDLELYAIQEAKELNWDTFKASKSFINDFKRENGI